MLDAYNFSSVPETFKIIESTALLESPFAQSWAEGLQAQGAPFGSVLLTKSTAGDQRSCQDM